MSETALVLSRGNGALSLDTLGEIEISLRPESVVQRNELIARANEIEQVTGEASQRVAIAMKKDLRNFVKAAETRRKQMKAPVIALGRKFEQVMDEFMSPLNPVIDRLDKAINAFTAEQVRIQREAEQKQREEAERLERERQRLERESQVATTPAQVEDLRAKQKEVAAQQSRVLSAPVPAAPKLDGVKRVPVWKYDVIDLVALVKARPDLCHIEINKSAMTAAIKGGLREIPGIANIREEMEVR